MAGNTPPATGAQPQGDSRTAPPKSNIDLPGGPPDVETLLARGTALCQSGRFSEAERAFRRILEMRPDHFDALHLLGIVCSQLGNHDEALHHIDAALRLNAQSADAHNSRGTVLAALKRLEDALASFETAIALDPRSAMAFSNRGNAHHELGQFAEASASYDTAIALDPDDAEAFYGRGNTLQKLGRLDEAVANYDRAIALRPAYAEAFANRGLALQELRRLDDAVGSYDRAIALKPKFPEALCNRGNALLEMRRFEEALASYNKALALRPSFPEAWSNRGKVFQELNRFEEALASYNKAIALRSDYADAFTHCGNVLENLNRFDEALTSHDTAIACKPDFAEAFGNRGNALRKLKRFDEALASYDRAIALRPDIPEVFNNRGVVLSDLKRVDEALASYDQAIALQPDYAGAYSNRAFLNLLAGNYKIGWEDNEWRWKTKDCASTRPNVMAAPWQGEDLAGRRLLVFTEQGLGDTVQFARYMPLLAERKAAVTFLVPSQLIRLLRPLTMGMRVVSSLGELEAFDFQCALMDLPPRFNTDLSSIPANIPYLRAEDSLIARWKQRIGGLGFKIGIAWQGNPQSGADEGRSVPLEHFVPLSRLAGVRLISLQKHHGLDQLARLPRDVRVETLGHDFDRPDAFVDTAAIMKNLDLIITSDTSIAHLAGALGRPTWIVLKYVPDWRWLLDRSDNPWYPTLRLFRQMERDRWGPVFAEIEGELRTLVSTALAL